MIKTVIRYVVILCGDILDWFFLEDEPTKPVAPPRDRRD